MVNNSSLWNGLQSGWLVSVCSACEIASSSWCCIVKNVLFPGVVKMLTSSPRAVSKGGISEVLPALLCAPTVPYAQVESVWALMKITFTPAPLLPIQITLCNRWVLGPGCLCLIAFLRQDQTGSAGGVWQCWEFDEFKSKNIHFSHIIRMTNRFWRLLGRNLFASLCGVKLI